MLSLDHPSVSPTGKAESGIFIHGLWNDDIWNLFVGWLMERDLRRHHPPLGHSSALILVPTSLITSYQLLSFLNTASFGDGLRSISIPFDWSLTH